jgi:phage shock protein PspC (stress-responsive transcriptional regulator)
MMKMFMRSRPARAVDGRAAGVAAGGAQDVQVGVPLLQGVVEEVAQELQRDVLEGQGRPVEQLEDPHRTHRPGGRDLRMAEARIAALDQLLQVGRRQVHKAAQAPQR